jgi:hypothetical protein
MAGMVAVVLIAAAAGAALQAFSRGGTANDGIDYASPTSLATVARRSLASRTNVDGTLGLRGQLRRGEPGHGHHHRAFAVGEVMRAPRPPTAA